MTLITNKYKKIIYKESFIFNILLLKSDTIFFKERSKIIIDFNRKKN